MTITAITPDERTAILDAVREFADAQFAPQALERDQRSEFPIDTLHAAGELGLGGLYVAEDVGGMSLSREDAAAIFETLAYADPTMSAYISIHNMVAWMIDIFGSAEQRQRFLPPLTAMQQFGAYCLTEPGAGSDAAAITTSAVRDGDAFVLNGAKQFISGAGDAGVYVVMARTSNRGSAGITAFIVPAGTEGLSFGPNEHKMGWRAQPTRPVLFDDVRVPADQVLGEVDGGFRIAMKALNGGRINIAACSLGGAHWALDRAAAYVQQRFTFGEPLSSQQTVQFAVADMATELHAARLMVVSGARAIDEGSADAAVQCAMAKRYATDVGFRIANEALQLHGGYGYLQDYGIEKVVRDLRVHQILEGTNEIMRVIIGRAILDKADRRAAQRAGGQA